MTEMPTDRELARAEALGRAAASEQLSVSTIPYPADQRVLRARWVLAYTQAGGSAGIDHPADESDDEPPAED